MATTTQQRSTSQNDKIAKWLLRGQPAAERRRKRASGEGDKKAWWQVMCLTGVDYYSTLGYQPGIAALAAGVVAPIATLVLVLLTLFGALPVYRRVARESPRGQGSIAMLERLLPGWLGKLLVLVLLGFAATDFVITMTLSAADASAHALENPLMPGFFHGQQMLLTLIFLALLGAVFLKGFTEAIGIAVALVGVYLVLTAVVVVVAAWHLVSAPALIIDWQNLLTSQHSNAFAVIGIALIVFPKLALGLSGFETGVAVMPQVRGLDTDTMKRPEGRIRNTRKLLLTAALIMSVFLIASSLVTTMLIPQQEFQPGGNANGRALAYLAHNYLGSIFGTLYDLSTISILWFAGASAMAGLLNLVPRYLPRYGMAPDWLRWSRPLVLVFSVIAFAITVIFNADVDAQGGAYATGVLVLITSAAFAVFLSAIRKKQRLASIAFGLITAVFIYTTVMNVLERPDGVKIASFFIVAIIVTSFISRATRSLELRITKVHFDATARKLVEESAKNGHIRIVANEPGPRDELEYRDKEKEAREDNHIPHDTPLLFLEVTLKDPSEFSTELHVVGEERFGYRILRVHSPTVPNAIAAVLLRIRDKTDQLPHIYFAWSEGNPIKFLFRYLFSGQGDVPPVTREVLRRAEPEPRRRPLVHVG